MEGTVEVDETYVGGQDDEALGRNEGKKKLVVIGIEKKGRGVSRMYGKVIETAEKKNLKPFMMESICLPTTPYLALAPWEECQ